MRRLVTAFGRRLVAVACGETNDFGVRDWFQAVVHAAPRGAALAVKPANYVLQAASALPAVSWTTVTNTPTVSGRDRRVKLPLTGNSRFFRLRQP